MRPLQALIDTEALRHNYRLACRAAPGSRALAVLKANAYGHGALECARALSDLAPAFGVAAIEEALALREGGITQPIVLLEGFFEPGELELIAAQQLVCVVHSEWQLEALAEARVSAPIAVWLKCDSGMHRLGFTPEAVPDVWRRLNALPAVGECGLMTHFATADQPACALFDRQLTAVAGLRQALGEPPVCWANSPATLSRPTAHGDWVRPGIMLYGADPLTHANDLSSALQPVMTLESRLIAVRELAAGEPVGYGSRFVTERRTRLGVVACGYGDGYDRHAVDGTPVLVDGQRAALAGRVSMDMLIVDITGLPAAGVGSRVTLWGRAPDGTVLPVNEVAACCDTISYTLLTGVTARVPRRPWLRSSS
ncbi:alanine racemase [Kushneria sinocarnis]|uniref:Alanine racemase n=1 Tax=Kushneria sinocarnis TaxID=595502 RepID=A0A420WX49_9GAMM|nr:alanine racemase [Kushneria sinocarnis]RKR04267.1 alanine racemase [Kushneria sinocarnis]